MTNYLTLPVGDHAPDVVNVVIEIPLGEVNKYEYDKTLQLFRLDRNLHSPVHYPGDYGFVPSTLAGDGDPLDVLVLVDTPSFSGCLIEVRPIGMLEMLDQGKQDEKILAVGLHNPRSKDVRNSSEISPHVLRRLLHLQGPRGQAHRDDRMAQLGEGAQRHPRVPRPLRARASGRARGGDPRVVAPRPCCAPNTNPQEDPDLCQFERFVSRP